MKSSAIIRIILYSILIFVLLSVLAAGIGFGIYSFHSFSTSFTTSGEYNSAENGEQVNVSDEIRNLNIQWASGSIKIQPADIDSIQFQESGPISEDNQMVWNQDDETLQIIFCKPSIKNSFSTNSSKKLTVLVPRQWVCDNLKLEVASADIFMEGITAAEVEIDSASGECEFVACTVNELDIDTASGRILYSGALNSLDCDAASASFTGTLYNTPDSIRMDSASGDLNITLPENSGFTVDMDSLSGKLHTDFDGSYKGDIFVCGDGHCEIRFDGASGKVNIYK